MAIPPFLLCDADALIQFLLLREVRPLRMLKQRYHIQPLIVPEVEQELRSNRKFSRRIGPELSKAVNNGSICILDKSLLDAHYGSAANAATVVSASLANIASSGKAFNQVADYGEAYTHAAALALQSPAMSNDITAIEALLNNGHSVPPTVLRPFDLVALAYQTSDMSANDCDKFRSGLIREREHVPRCFLNQSFENGLRNYAPRVRDRACASVGIVEAKPRAFATVLIL